MFTTHTPYKLYDIYDLSNEYLDTVTTYEEAYNAAYDWIEETDGECSICYSSTTDEIDNDFELLISQAIAKAMNDYFD